MKKIIPIIIILMMILSFTNNYKENNNVFIECIVLDSLTKEPLTGVKIKTDKQNIYTDFDGKAHVKQNSNVDINLISYEKINKTLYKNDTILLKNI